MFRRVSAVAVLGLLIIGTAAGASSNVIQLGANDVAVFGPTQCSAQVEAGSSGFLCQRTQAARYQASIYSDSILVWRVGNPDTPVFSTSGPTQAELQQVVLRDLCRACKGWKVTFSRIRVSKVDDHFAYGSATRIVTPQGQAQPSPFVLFKAGTRWTVLTMVTDNTLCRGIPKPVRRDMGMRC
jgi:hypothetical protein